MPRTKDQWFQHGWRRIVYYIGYLGVFNLFWWLTLVIAYFAFDKGKKIDFFGLGFKRRVYYWGCIYVGVFVIIAVVMIVAGLLAYWASGFVTNQTTSGVQTQTTIASGAFTLVENAAYESLYCDKINPYDLQVRKAAADATRNHPGPYSINQLLDIYDWVKQNVNYLNVPVDISSPYPPNQTLYTMSGDCKNQAVLIASMVKSIGGSSKVILDPTCQHAYAIVFISYTNQSMQPIIDQIGAHYNKQLYVNWFSIGDQNWLIFDPAGGYYPGNTLPECSGNRTIYKVNSCVSS